MKLLLWDGTGLVLLFKQSFTTFVVSTRMLKLPGATSLAPAMVDLPETATESRLWSASTPRSNQGQLAGEERFCVAFRRPTFHAPQSSQSEKGLGIEPFLGPLAAEMRIQQIDLAL